MDPLPQKTTYFERRRTERGISMEQVKEALANEVARRTQPDGRTQIWGFVEGRGLYFRVVLTHDGKLLHVFPDANFTRKRKG